MNATKQHKTRFRKNLKQFLSLKEAGKMNGQTASVKGKLKDAAKEIGLNFEKELKSMKRENPCGCGQRENPSKEKENILHGIEAIKKVIETHEDVDKAMKHPKLGWISFVWGEDERYGVSHILARRSQEALKDMAFKNQDAKSVALRLPIVIEKGSIVKEVHGKKVYIELAGYRVILSRDWHGDKKDWLLTGFRMPKNRKNPDETDKLTSFIRLYAPEAYKFIQPQAVAGLNLNKDTKNFDNRKNPETTPQCVVSVQAETDAVKNGIEIRFTGRPPKEILEKLHEAGFLYYTPKGEPSFWSAKISPETKKAAEEIAGVFDSAVVGLKKRESSNGKRETADVSNGRDASNASERRPAIFYGDSTIVDFKADGSKQQKGRYAIMHIASLEASHNKDCSVNSKHLISRSQPRDRSKDALCAQPKFIAKNLNVASITLGNLAFQGAPVVLPNGQVIQGNGRTIALKIAYSEHPKSAKKYRKYLIQNAKHFGFEEAEVKEFKNPVLVRVLDVSKVKAIQLGNVVDTSQAKMSKIDQAKAYIRNLSTRKLEIIGKLIRESDGETIGEIIDDVGMSIIKQLEDLDRTGIVSQNGLTVDGKRFLRSVLVGLVFDSEDHPKALHHYLKLLHTIKAGLERSFGYIIPLIGNKGDITGELAKAVEVAAQVKNSDSIETAKEYANTDDMFESKSFAKQEIALAQFLLDADTQKFIRNGFRFYDELLKGKKTLFGKTPPKSKKEAFETVFIDRVRPNPSRFVDEVIHENIVRAQRLQTLGNDNSKELQKLDYLLGHDGWKWNDEKTQIVRTNKQTPREIVEHYYKLAGPRAGFDFFAGWIKDAYPEKAEEAKKIWNKTHKEKRRRNPEKLTDKIKRAVLDDFYAWIKGNPLIDYEPGPTTFGNWIQYHYPGYEDRHESIWAFARPLARKNPNARFILLGLNKELTIDQGNKNVTLRGPQVILTNKKMNKLFIVPVSELEDFNKKVKDVKAEQVFEQWSNYQADDENFSVNWPEDDPLPVGTAKEITYISDKIMKNGDSKGEDHMYHHVFDAGKRPAVRKGKMLIFTNIKIDERGILN